MNPWIILWSSYMTKYACLPMNRLSLLLCSFIIYGPHGWSSNMSTIVGSPLHWAGSCEHLSGQELKGPEPLEKLIMVLVCWRGAWGWNSAWPAVGLAAGVCCPSCTSAAFILKVKYTVIWPKTIAVKSKVGDYFAIDLMSWVCISLPVLVLYVVGTMWGQSVRWVGTCQWA